MSILQAIPSSISGTYVLVFSLSERQMFRAGKKIEADLLPGHYLYIGSAFGPGGLRARLNHHIHLRASARWHVDYLNRVACLKEIWYTTATKRREHDWVGLFQHLTELSLPVEGFGSSDCLCWAHLFYSEKFPLFEHFKNLLKQFFPDDPPLQRLTIVKL